MPIRTFSVKNEVRPLPEPWIRLGVDSFDEHPGNIQIGLGLPTMKEVVIMAVKSPNTSIGA